MNRDVISEIIGEYDSKADLLGDFTDRVEQLVSELLDENDIEVHSITSRLKERRSLESKLSGSDTGYTCLQDVTDICGIRIITYFSDSVDYIAKIIGSEFEIDWSNSVDKRAQLDPDRFGYISLHYIATLPKNRLQLTEYRRFQACKFEIQIRSILQHAWAEIEHDLGYKSEQAVPRDIRRRFSRLAGLLELADSEFKEIRDALEEYEDAVPQQIDISPSSVTIDQASLSAYVRTSPIVQELDRRLIEAAGWFIDSNEELSDSSVDGLYFVGLQTIADVDTALQLHSDLIIRFAEQWVTDRSHEGVRPGISLFYLRYILIAKTGSVDMVLDYLNFAVIGVQAERESIAQGIMFVYENAVTQMGSKDGGSDDGRVRGDGI